MGSPVDEIERGYDETQHRVQIDSFLMSAFEVTQTQWKTVMEYNPSNFTGPGRPVEQVNWVDAVRFCNKLSKNEGLEPVYSGTPPHVEQDLSADGYRLPTEAEWEYACRAGTTTAFHYGDKLNSKMANFDGNYPYNSTRGIYRKETLPVGEFPPNSFGLYDMHGNVNEWCWDWYDYYPKEPQVNPRGPEKAIDRVSRGGGWPNHGASCRSASRLNNSPYFRHSAIGFRIVRSVGDEMSISPKHAILKP